MIEAVDGPLTAGAPIGGGFPDESHTRLREALECVTSTARNQLAQIKLACLLKKQGG